MSAPATPPSPTIGGLTVQELQGIQGFTSSWARQGSGGPGTSLRSRQFNFTAYLAKYGDPHDPNRGGDWSANVRVVDGKVVAGSLPNLLYLISKNVARPHHRAARSRPARSLQPGNLRKKSPPFIFFTGHRDFTLTALEVENLQKYIRLGGCIWGDSSLPGRNSRFDIAFRREMRRVIPDKDKDFEPLPPTHDIFTSGRNYYPDVREVPSGINFYHEPVYVLRFGGEIAIFYTANDYGDMWQFGLDDQWHIDSRKDENSYLVAQNSRMWQMRDTYFRNINEPALKATYEFGTNVVLHLLTRWEDKLKNVPKGL